MEYGAKCASCGKKLNPAKAKTCCGKKMCTKCLLEHFAEDHKSV